MVSDLSGKIPGTFSPPQNVIYEFVIDLNLARFFLYVNSKKELVNWSMGL